MLPEGQSLLGTGFTIWEDESCPLTRQRAAGVGPNSESARGSFRGGRMGREARLTPVWGYVQMPAGMPWQEWGSIVLRSSC